MKTEIVTFTQSVERKLRPQSRSLWRHVAVLLLFTAFFSCGGLQAHSSQVWAIVAFILVGLWASLLPRLDYLWDILPVTKRLAHLLQEGNLVYIARQAPTMNFVFIALASHGTIEAGDALTTHSFIGSLHPDDLAQISPELRQLEADCPNQIFWVK